MGTLDPHACACACTPQAAAHPQAAANLLFAPMTLDAPRLEDRLHLLLEEFELFGGEFRVSVLRRLGGERKLNAGQPADEHDCH